MKNYGFKKTTIQCGDKICKKCLSHGKLCPFLHIDGEYCDELLELLKGYDSSARSLE